MTRQALPAAPTRAPARDVRWVNVYEGDRTDALFERRRCWTPAEARSMATITFSLSGRVPSYRLRITPKSGVTL